MLDDRIDPNRPLGVQDPYRGPGREETAQWGFPVAAIAIAVIVGAMFWYSGRVDPNTTTANYQPPITRSAPAPAPSGFEPPAMTPPSPQ